jgi:hypothetical protein
MTEFDACFDRFEHSAHKLETRRQTVAPGEAERIQAFQEGAARPVRSVRTEPWLARIAVTTATAGKSWQRVRILDQPLTLYQEYGMAGLVESQAAGEQVRITLRGAVPGLVTDFWWFDPGWGSEFALLLFYDEGDRFSGFEVSTDRDVLEACAADWHRAFSVSVSLNEYLAHGKRASRAA